jgi:site-specific DNA recombinase
VFDFYEDDGYSGKDLIRPEMQRLINDCENKKVQAIVVLKLDRLSRKQRDVLYLLEDIFEKNGVGFKSVTEPFDTTTPFGKAAIGMMAVFAQLERETIIERVRIAKKEAAQQGRYMGGPVAYGYKYDLGEQKVSVVDDEAAIVRKIFSDYIKGMKGYQSIVDELNEKKIFPPATASQWNRGTIRAMLRNAFYAGYIEHEGILYEGRHERLITHAEFESVQRLKGIKRKQFSRKIPQIGDNLLTGIIFCGECGAKVRYKEVNKSRKDPAARNAYYVCYSAEGNKMMKKTDHCLCGYKRVEVIEDYVVNYLKKFSFDHKLIAKIIKEQDANDDKQILTHTLSKLRRESAATQQKIDRWYDAFETGILDADSLQGRVKGLREHKAYLEQKLLDYTEEIKLAASKKTLGSEVVETLENFPAIWSETTIIEKRGILRGIIQAIRLFKDDHIEIDFVDF